MAKKINPYLEDFLSMIEYSVQAAEYLNNTLKNFNVDDMSKHRKVMHDLEHGEDIIKHNMIKRLIKEFVTPIDREDIYNLANEMDNITDKIEDILIRMYMYNIKDIKPGAIDLSEIILRCCKSLKEALLELPKFHKSELLTEKIVEVNTLEEQGDLIYIKAVRNLYDNGGNELEIVSWSALFDRFEEVCDACEHVANFIESIVMKNS